MPSDELNVLGTDGVVGCFLYRTERTAGDFYSTARQITSKQDLDLIGVATRERGTGFESAQSRDTFRDAIEALAEDVYWFDEPVPTGDCLAELLYRTAGDADGTLYAATRMEREFTAHEILGVVVRAGGHPVEATEAGIRPFAAAVQDVADGVVWFTPSEEISSQESPATAASPRSHSMDMSEAEFAYTFDAIHDVAARWDITPDEAEVFLERAGYFDTARYHEIADVFSPTPASFHDSTRESGGGADAE